MNIAGVPHISEARIRATGIQMLTALDFANVLKSTSVTEPEPAPRSEVLKCEESANSSQPAVDSNTSLVMERRKFRRRLQKPGESPAAYLKSLEAMSKECGFSSKAYEHENLLNQFIEGLRDEELSRKMLHSRSR